MDEGWLGRLAAAGRDRALVSGVVRGEAAAGLPVVPGPWRSPVEIGPDAVAALLVVQGLSAAGPVRHPLVEAAPRWRLSLALPTEADHSLAEWSASLYRPRAQGPYADTFGAVYTVLPVIDFAAERAVYKQIADELRAQIQSGQLGPGDELPSVRHLAQQYGVGTDTIQRTIDVLRNEGIIGTVRGYPAWVVEEKDRAQVRVPRGAELVVRMPSDAERTALGIEPGVVVPIVVVVLGGRERGKYAADRVRLTFS